MTNQPNQAVAATQGFVAPKKEPKGPSKSQEIIKNIAANAGSEKDENMLGIAPDFDRSLLEEIEAPKSIFLLLLKILFALLLLGGIVSSIFFTFQLSNKFAFISNKWDVPTVYNDIISSNSELANLQTDLNYYRHLQGKAYLDEFTYYGDMYIQYFDVSESQTVSSYDQEEAKKEMDRLREPMRTAFLATAEKLGQPLEANLVAIGDANEFQANYKFTEDLRAIINQKIQSIGSNDDPEAKREMKNYQHILKLIGNTKLASVLNATDFDALDDEGIYLLVRNINSMVTNDLSTIQKIKEGRIRWSDIINELELRTQEVDEFYTQSFYDQFGGILYTSYDFDSKSRRVSIVGETKTLDTTTFSLISNLIDKLNSSEMFSNAEMRSFSKSGTLEDGYTSTLKLSVDMKDEKNINDEELTE